MAHALNMTDYAANAPVREGFFARIRQSFVNYRKFVAVYDELQALSDRELADLGMSRFDLRQIANEAAK